MAAAAPSVALAPVAAMPVGYMMAPYGLSAPRAPAAGLLEALAGIRPDDLRALFDALDGRLAAPRAGTCAQNGAQRAPGQPAADLTSRVADLEDRVAQLEKDMEEARKMVARLLERQEAGVR